jgi:magnesium transporter
VIQYFACTNDALERTLTLEPSCWVDVVRPNDQERYFLREQHDLPRDFLVYALDPDERPRLEREQSTTLIVVQVSHWLGHGSATPYDTVPLGVILTPSHVLTVCGHRHTVLLDLKRGKFKVSTTTNQARFLLHVLLRVAQRYLLDLRAIDRRLESLEARLSKSTQNKELLELMRLEKSLVYFKTALRSNLALLERLRREQDFIGGEAATLEDVVTETAQALEMTDIALSILSTTTGAFAAVIGNNLNEVVRVLTVVTVAVALPTWITGVFGMNVPLPWQTEPWSFAGVMLLCVVVVVGLLALLRRRGWV